MTSRCHDNQILGLNKFMFSQTAAIFNCLLAFVPQFISIVLDFSLGGQKQQVICESSVLLLFCWLYIAAIRSIWLWNWWPRGRSIKGHRRYTVNMGQCFAPDCNHQSESHTCKFFLFPNQKKKPEEYRRWIRLLRYETFLF